MRQDRRGLPTKARVQIPHGRIMVALVFGAKKSEDRAARCRAPQRVLWRLGLCRLAGDAGQRRAAARGHGRRVGAGQRKEAGQRHFHGGAVQHPCGDSRGGPEDLLLCRANIGTPTSTQAGLRRMHRQVTGRSRCAPARRESTCRPRASGSTSRTCPFRSPPRGRGASD